MDLGLGDFAGEWWLSRRIVHDQAPEAQFEGRAWFTSNGGGLRYREDGTLTIQGQGPIRAERGYLWSTGAGGLIEVAFDDGRAFHHFDPAAPQPEDRHYCDPDIYDVTYDFTAWPVWSVRWQVQGPRKAYTLYSDYRRAGGG